MACLEFLFIQYTYCESSVDKGMRVRSDRSVDWCLDWCLTGGILLKKQFLKFRNTDKKTPALESLFNKVSGHQTCNVIKKRLQQRCFPVNTAKFLRTPILKIIYERLPLSCLIDVLSSLIGIVTNILLVDKIVVFCDTTPATTHLTWNVSLSSHMQCPFRTSTLFNCIFAILWHAKENVLQTSSIW